MKYLKYCESLKITSRVLKSALFEFVLLGINSFLKNLIIFSKCCIVLEIKQEVTKLVSGQIDPVEARTT